MSACGPIGRNGALSLLLVLALALVGGMSCAGAPAEDAAPAEEQQEDVPDVKEGVEEAKEGEVLAVEWAADGSVTPGEYANSLDKGTYRLYWVSTEATIRVAIEADTSGWVAVGFQPGKRMKDADIVLGMVSDGETIVIDSHSTGDFGPHGADSDLGGTDDLLGYGARESDGVTVVEFERALNTGDAYDVALQSGVATGIIWAYGTADNEGVKHSTRGYGEIVP